MRERGSCHHQTRSSIQLNTGKCTVKVVEAAEALGHHWQPAGAG